MAMVKSRSSIADFEALEVDHDLVGDVGGVAHQLELVADDVEHAAAADARRIILVDEADRHVDVDGAVRADAQEIDMQRTVVDRVELDVAGERAGLLAAHIDHHDGIHEVSVGQRLDQRLFLDVDAYRVLLVAVDHGGYSAFAANSTGGSLACPFARFGRQHKLLAHLHVSKG